MFINKLINGKPEPIKISQLSDGGKILIMLVVDIARRIAIANPGLYMNEETTDRDPNYAANVLKNATGIIIIDEIDLHLHPKWQRLVIPALTTTFPNIQFVVTTHSSLAISSGSIKEVVRLDQSGNKLISLKSEEDRSYEYLFEDIFQTKPKFKNTGYDD